MLVDERGKYAGGMTMLFLLIAVLAAFALGGCTEKNGAAPEIRTTAPEYVLTYAENQAEDYPTTLGAYRFAELVEERTNGRIIIEVKASAVLGDEQSVIEQLQFGGIDFTRASLSSMAEFIPKLNVLQMPYLYTGADHMWRVLEGEIGDDFLDSFGEAHLVGLSWYDAGARNFYNSVRPIEKLEDMKGMNIRVQESKMMAEMVRALEANATPMTFDNVYSGLQTGEIDGAENNWPSYESMGHYEVAKYYTVDEHTRVPEAQLISEVTWNKLSGEDRSIIRECAQESARYQRELWAARERVSEAKVREAGCQVVELPAEEKRRFREAVRPLYEEFCADYMDIIEAIGAEG